MSLTFIPCEFSLAQEPCSDATKKAIGALPLRLSSCERVRALDLDVFAAIAHHDSCLLPGGRNKITLSEVLKEDDRQNGYLRATLHGQVIGEIAVAPQSPIKLNDGVGPQNLACDEVSRSYWAHSSMGYVVAHRIDWPSMAGDNSGTNRFRELWRVSLPGFVRPEDSEIVAKVGGERPLNVMDLIAALDAGASLVQQVVPSGPYIAVEYNNTKQGFSHLLLHRSGRVLARLGPWEGVAVGAVDGGWRFAVDGGKDIALFTPKAVVTITVRDTDIEPLVRHALAWLTPRPTNRDASLTECLNRPPGELRYWLGSAFDESLATKARARLIQLGREWRESLEKTPHVLALLRRFDPASSAWQAEYRVALLDAGVDVDVLRSPDPSLGGK